MPTPPFFERFMNPQPRSARQPAPPAVPRRGLVIGGVIVAVIVLALIVMRILGFYLDWLWFGEVGFRTVFWGSFWARLVVGAVAFVAFFVIVWPNVELARRLAPEFRASEQGDIVELVRQRARRIAFWVGLGVAAAVSLVAAVVTSGDWLTFLKAVNAERFGINDPVFGHDVAFYVFTVPAWHAVQTLVFGALVVSLILAAIMHLALGGGATTLSQPQRQGPGQRFPRPQLGFEVPPRAVAHLCALLAAVFVVIGVGQLFKAWGLLAERSGIVNGVGYTDVYARIPGARILMAVAFIIAAVLVWNIWRRVKWWPYTIVAWVVVYILVQWAYPAIVQGLIVNPNEFTKEKPYLEQTLAFTKKAYDLEGIRQVPMDKEKGLSAGSLEANELTVRNVRLWDPETLTTSYQQLQQLRPYYAFVDAGVDRYQVGDSLRQTMLSARELNIAGLPQQAQTWVNQHITYTHGYGVALSAVNQVTADGSPDFLVQDVPPEAADPNLQIDQPRIYYGQIGTQYTLVKTKEKEFDYPGGGGDEYKAYDGSGGIPTSSFLQRLALSVRFRTIKFFTTSALTSQSRVILHNNITERVQKAAPFLLQDEDPYMVIADGKLYWIVDCYTTTGKYPYSEPDGPLNYIRNSVKAVVDAYNGSVSLYLFDEEDPLIKTYDRCFPGVFQPASAMPEGLRDHVRYPEGIFNVQARLYTTYHVDDAAVLYNKGDQWQVPTGVSGSGEGPMAAYYVVLKLPGEDREEFIQMLPFVPNGRPNMVAWLAARSDGQGYGESLAIMFPKRESIYGPNQVEAAINQDPEVSAQLTLWDQAGSNTMMGNLLIMPIEDSLLYVQPLYLESEQNKIPQVKQVVVFYRSPSTVEDGPQGQFVSMKPTLGEALEDIFGTAAGADEDGEPQPEPTETPGPTPTGSPGPGEVPADLATLIERANAQFEAAQAALQDGDWAEYGRQIDALEDTLRQLQSAQ